MYDDVCTLVTETRTLDTYGIPVITTQQNEVFCQVRSITRSEFYAAAATDLNPEYVFRLSNSEDYNGESLVLFHNLAYTVIRTYRGRGDAIELVVERKAGTNNSGDSNVY